MCVCVCVYVCESVCVFELVPKLFMEAAHGGLEAVAREQGCTESRLIGQVSRHTLPSTASFANLNALYRAVGSSSSSISISSAQPCYLSTSGSALVFSTRFSEAESEDSSTAGTTPRIAIPPTAAQGKRKRQLCEDQEDGVVKARRRLSATSSLATARELDTAQRVVEQVLRLRGPAGEVLVQSYALLTKKLKPTDASPSVVVAIRLSSGIAVSIAALKRCLGGCWQDGLVSSESSVNGVCDRDLPLTEEGAASLSMGNLPLLIVTSIPKPPAGASDA